MANKKDILSEKGLFERLVRVETKIDIASKNDQKTDIKFSGFVFVLMAVEVLNLYLNYKIIMEHHNLTQLIQTLFK